MHSVSVLFTLSALLASLPAVASGSFRIGGESDPVTCSLATAEATVQLPAINTSELSTVGAVAGTTPFQIAMTCDDSNSSRNNGNKYLLYARFDAANVDTATGNLIVATGSQAATNVQVRILNADNSVVNLANGGLSTVQDADLDYSVSFTFYAQYYATGQATSGSVSTYTTYSIAYN